MERNPRPRGGGLGRPGYMGGTSMFVHGVNFLLSQVLTERMHWEGTASGGRRRSELGSCCAREREVGRQVRERAHLGGT